MNIKRLVKPCVRKLKAYKAEEPTGVRVKLDANESPYGYSLSRGAIATNRYPDPEGSGVRRLLARQMRVPMGQVMLGNGSDELIYYLVTTFGGVNASGIRPLFLVCLVGTIATFFLILTRLSNRKWGKLGETSLSFFRDLSQIFKQGHNLKRWLLITCVGNLPFFMLLPFVQPFAHEVKGADQYVLGAMVTGSAVVPLVLGIPAGRLADKIGRKKVIYLTMPLVWAFSLMLIWAPSPGFLIGAGVLQGFIYVSSVVMGAMTFELVPVGQMGRWMGVVRFFRMMLSAGTVYLAGVIWDNIGPQYLFLGVIAFDLLIRIPLLIGMPETLGLRLGAEQPE